MSQKLKIMNEAEDASRLLRQYDPADGERRFKELLGQYPGDGMIYFKRGEGYEAVGKYERALADYTQAVALFPMRDWKNLARQGLERVKQYAELAKLPRELQGIWRDVVQVQIGPPRSLAMTCRAALEKNADLLIHKWGLTAQGPELRAKLSTLVGSRRVPREIIDDMRTVKDLGDAAAHGNEINARQREACYDAASRIVNFMIAGRRHA